MSKHEQMAYKMQPAGHEESERKREFKKGSELDKLCLKWLESCRKNTGRGEDTWYNSAKEILSDTDATIADANALTLRFSGHKFAQSLGLFLSVVYNKSQEKEIVYDINSDNPPILLGYKLPKKKTLIIKGTVAHFCGKYSKGNIVHLGSGAPSLGQKSPGVIMNYGDADENLGQESSGTVLNFGNTNNVMGTEAKGLVINLGNAAEGFAYESEATTLNFGITGKYFGHLSRGIVANAGQAGYHMGLGATGVIIATHTPQGFADLEGAKRVVRYDYTPRTDLNQMKGRMKGIHEYLDNIKSKFEKGKTDYKKALEILKEFGTNPAERIKNDIESILKRSGYNV